MKRLFAVAALSCAAFLVGCGGGGSTNGGGHQPPTMQSISVGPTTPTIASGASQQFTATAHFSDNSTQDVTSNVTWSSSATTVATISSTGMAQGVAGGSATITAAHGSMSGNTLLTVNSSARVLTSIVISPSNPTINPGSSQQFSAMGHYNDGSVSDISANVTWASSATSVATINSTGKALSVSPGSTTITATQASISGSTLLTISTLQLTSISVTPSLPSIPLGTLQQLTATGTYNDGTHKNISTSVVWSSSSPGFASVDTKGLVTGVGLGTSNIKATSGSISGSTSLTVNSANVVSLKIQPADSTIANGTTAQLAALVTFNDGSTLNVTTTPGVSWNSSNAGVATIGSINGFATSKAAGSTMISASFGTVGGSTSLSVSNASLQSIAISPTNIVLAPHITQKFTATGNFSDGSVQNISNIVTWGSDNAAAATISNSAGSNGVATGVAQGMANITASFSGSAVTGSTPLKVSNATLSSITVTPGASTISPATILQYTATGNFSDGSTEPLSLVANWNSSAPSVVSINGAGLATGVTAGSANISASYNGVTSNSVALSVNGAPLSSMAVTCAKAHFAINTSEACGAVGTFADGSTQTLTPVVHWTSSQNNVATISNTAGLRGNISGVAPGTATITAYLNGVVGETDVTVTNAQLTSISIAPGTPTISLGGTQAFVAQGNFDDGSSQSLTSEPAYLVQLEGDDRAFVWDVIFVNWTTSSSNVAVITKAGIATSTGTGTTTVNATLNGVSGSANLTVQ
jgi:uncharacterized protein YjdB